MNARKFTALSLLLTTLALSLTPLFSTPVQAQFAGIVSDPATEAATAATAGTVAVTETHKTLREMANAIALGIAQVTIEHIAASSIKWAQSGFEGNPAYVTNPEQYFSDIADGVAGQYIKNSKNLGFLCSPFQAQIRLSLDEQYHPINPFQCTLTGVIGNIENFYDDFSQGGWDAWFTMTQNPVNNPYGAFLAAKIDLDSQVAGAVQNKVSELNRNQGFLSWKTCPAQYQVTAAQAAESQNGVENGDEDSGGFGVKPDGTPYQAGDCISDSKLVVNTPGTVIKDQIDKVLPAGLDKLVNAQTVEQVVAAFAAGILQRYVFGPKGLFSGGDTPTYTDKMVDIDGDGIPDGTDNTGDGKPDICFYGGTATPAGPPCRGSHTSNTDLPPYLPPLPVPGAGGGQCSVSGGQYESALRSAIDAVLSANPNGIADKPNDEVDGFKTNGKIFMQFVAAELQKNGYNATAEVLNGNNRTNKGEDVAIWREGDVTMERYEALAGGSPSGSKSIKDSISIEFSGFIPLSCTSSGGGKDCGCKSTTTTTEPAPTNSCTITGQNESEYLLLLLNDQGTAPSRAASMTNSRFGLTTGGEAVYYSSSNTIGLPEFYAAGPTASRSVSPTTGKPWDIVWRCGGGATTPTEPVGINPPAITSVSPTSVSPGQTITINGSGLTSTVQFFDGAGARYTVGANVNSSQTQTSATVPSMPNGNATVKVYKDSNTISNGKLITITGGSGGATGTGGGTLTPVTPLRSWSPTQTANGWWPSLSSDGKWVAYGNAPESWVSYLGTDLAGDNQNLSQPTDLPSGYICYGGKFIGPAKVSFGCYKDLSWIRYEVTPGIGNTPQNTGDNPNLVGGNFADARDGHWAAFTVSNGNQRLVKDNQILSTDPAKIGGKPVLTGNLLVTSCTTTPHLCVWNGTSLSQTYAARAAFNDFDAKNGYIIYTGPGMVRGITPAGTALDLSTTVSGGNEISPKIVMVGSKPWVATFYEASATNWYVLLRPWGQKTPSIVMAATGLIGDIVYANNTFVVAMYGDRGQLTVRTVDAGQPVTGPTSN